MPTNLHPTDLTEQNKNHSSQITAINPTFDSSRPQVGRSSESPIDFVVMDTLPGDKKDTKVMQSTISRFACRIIVDRSEAQNARIYAAGFDSSRNIFLGVSTSGDPPPVLAFLGAVQHVYDIPRTVIVPHRTTFP